VCICGSANSCSRRSCIKRDESLPGLGSNGDGGSVSPGGVSSSSLRNGMVGDKDGARSEDVDSVDGRERVRKCGDHPRNTPFCIELSAQSIS
jgi:hypothetical protein